MSFIAALNLIHKIRKPITCKSLGSLSKVAEDWSLLIFHQDLNLQRLIYLLTHSTFYLHYLLFIVVICRLFGTTGYCAACTKVIPAFEMVMRAKSNVYHLECFACQQCNHRWAGKWLLDTVWYEAASINDTGDKKRFQLFYCFTLLTQFSTVLVEKLAATRTHSILSAFHGTWMFNTVFTGTTNWPLFLARWIHFTLPHPISCKINFNMNNPSVPWPSFQMSLLYVCYILCQSYPPSFPLPYSPTSLLPPLL